MRTKLFAHRGASQYAPENTLAAFKRALELGAEGVELDVHLTKDNIPVIIHDETIDRTTNHHGFVKDFTYLELQQFDAGSWFADTFKQERIIDLETFLTWAKTNTLTLNIEFKNDKIDYRHLEPIVYELVQQSHLLERTLFSSFNKKSIKRLQHINEVSDIAWITSKRNRHLIRDARHLNVDAIHINYRLLSKQLMQQAQQEELAVRAYTVNKQKHLLNCFEQQCNGVFTDVPDIGRNVRQHYDKNR